MADRDLTTLYLAPARTYVEAEFVPLTPELAERRVMGEWWSDNELDQGHAASAIDRWWDWNAMGIEFSGTELASRRVALVTGDGPVQGAMLVSTDPVPSALERAAGALFVELLFTAPRNRPALRSDGRPYLIGVGTELLVWAARLSQSLGHQGRVRLDGSPDFLTWYQKRGLQSLAVDPIVFEGVSYTPMELTGAAADRLIGLRDAEK